MKIAGKKRQNIAENVHQMGYHYGWSSTESVKIEIHIAKLWMYSPAQYSQVL